MSIHLEAARAQYQFASIKPDKVDEKTNQIAALTRQVARESWFSKPLVALDEALDYIPVFSSFNNLANLGIKKCLIKDYHPIGSSLKSYIQHLHDKSVTKCLVFAIPVLGNMMKISSVVADRCLTNNQTIQNNPDLDHYLDEIILLNHLPKLSEAYDDDKKVTI